MVAPIDAKVTFTVEGEVFTLRLNFRTVSLLEDCGLDLFSPNGVEMTLAKSAIMCRCLAVCDHANMTDDEALAIVSRGNVAFGEAVIELLARFGGKADGDEGNGEAVKAA